MATGNSALPLTIQHMGKISVQETKNGRYLQIGSHLEVVMLCCSGSGNISSAFSDIKRGLKEMDMPPRICKVSSDNDTFMLRLHQVPRCGCYM